MPITFDPAVKRVILDSTDVTATELYSRWCDWVVLSDNIKYLPAFRSTGGDDLGGGLSIPPYYFLLNGWRVRPMESSHDLTITGNLFVEGGGIPVVNTIGTFQINVNYTVPVQAQGISTAGGGGLTIGQAAQLLDLWQRLGLDPANPMTTTDVQIVAGDVEIQMTQPVAGTIVSTRQ